jgi:transcriptional regulator with XRE-family HTH domain
MTLGAVLRKMRKDRQLPLRSVAAAAEMDSTLLSKIEHGQRLPTETQARSLAAFYKLSFEELEAQRLAERFWSEHGDSPAAKKAVTLLREKAAGYSVRKRRSL